MQVQEKIKNKRTGKSKHKKIAFPTDLLKSHKYQVSGTNQPIWLNPIWLGQQLDAY
jgi:hypothetical protein